MYLSKVKKNEREECPKLLIQQSLPSDVIYFAFLEVLKYS
jgi:hypothetical protein